MYSVSNDYLEKITSSSREVSWYGSIKLSSGTIVPFDTSNIASGSLSVNYDVSSDENPSIGNAFAGELKLNLYTTIDRYSLYGAEVTAFFRLYLTENTYEDVPLGVFYITEAERTSYMVSIVAYDGMTKLDSIKVGEDKSGSYPYEWIKSVVERGGLELGTSSAEIGAMPNGNEQITFTQSSETITSMSCRDALGYLSAVVCANAFIGRDGKVYIKGYDDAEVATIGADGRFSSSIADYTTRYTAVSLTISSTNATEYYAETTDDGLTFALGTNPFLQSGSSAERETVCRSILNGLSVIEYVPFSMGLPVRPELDIMDVLMLTGNQATSSIGAITSLDFSSSGSMNVECTGANPLFMGVKTKTEKAIQQINNTVAKEINQMSVVQNSSSVTCGENTETSILTYNFEVTQEENTTMVDVSVVIDSHARESLVNDVYTLSDVVANLSFYVDDSEVGVYSPRFIVDEGNDTITFNYSLSGLSVGAHEFDVRLTMNGAYGIVGAGNAHEMLWGYGITFEVYVKSIEVTTLPTTTTFYAGQRLNYNGIVVSGVYNNGLRTDVTSESSFYPAQGTALTESDVGTLTVDVDYDSFSTDFDLNVELLGFDFLVSDDVIPDRNTSQQRMMLFEEDGQLYTAIPDVSSASPFVRYTKLSVASDGTVSVTEANTLTINFDSARTKYYMVKDGTKFYAMAFGGYGSEFGCIDIKNGTVQTYTMTFEYMPDPDMTVYTFVPDGSGTSVYAWLTSGYVCIDNVRGYLLDNGSYVSYQSMAWGEINGTNIHFRVLDKDQYDYSYYHVGIYACFPLERWVIGTEREIFSKYEDGRINIYQLACGTGGLYTNLVASVETSNQYTTNRGYGIYGAGKIIFPYWITGTYSTIKYVVYDAESESFFTGEINERDNTDLFYALNNAEYNSMGFDKSKGMFLFHYSVGERTTQYVYATADFTTWIEVAIPSEYFDTFLETYSSQHNNLVAFGGHLIDFGMDSSNAIHPAALIYKVD